MHYALLIALIFLMLGFIISTLRGRDTQLPDS
jgi:hypothetical protein